MLEVEARQVAGQRIEQLLGLRHVGEADGELALVAREGVEAHTRSGQTSHPQPTPAVVFVLQEALDAPRRVQQPAIAQMLEDVLAEGVFFRVEPAVVALAAVVRGDGRHEDVVARAVERRAGRGGEQQHDVARRQAAARRDLARETLLHGSAGQRLHVDDLGRRGRPGEQDQRCGDPGDYLSAGCRPACSLAQALCAFCSAGR